MVRLKTADKKIVALEKTNRKKQAEQTKKSIAAQNNAIYKAFKNNYSFSKIYFFEGRDAKYLHQQKYDKVTFYNVDRLPVDDKTFLHNGYFIAAIDYVHEIVFVQTSDTIRKKGSATFGIPSLVLMDKDFIQLDRPFPHRVLKGNDLLLEANEVLELNIQLHEFYKRYQKYKARKAKRAKRKRS